LAREEAKLNELNELALEAALEGKLDKKYLIFRVSGYDIMLSGSNSGKFMLPCYNFKTANLKKQEDIILDKTEFIKFWRPSLLLDENSTLYFTFDFLDLNSKVLTNAIFVNPVLAVQKSVMLGNIWRFVTNWTEACICN
jgi:hypothetical protein